MDAQHLEIATKLGKLKGLVKESVGISKKKYYSFQGIPYAKPPVGKLRFKDPVPFGQWEGVRDATKEGNDCVQVHMLFHNLYGDEDCLYLNVYTPQDPGKIASKKAVMVWIHGGAFRSGSSSTELYGPDYLIEEGVVLVTINYRVGALGFLSLENGNVPGNAGLKDQALALRWVQDNIDSFGGDSKNVTVFGESAGGASVHYQLLSPLSRGLFQKAIIQSGFAVCQWPIETNPKKKALLLAKELGCTSEDADTVLEFLLSLPAKDIIQAQESEALQNDLEKVQRGTLVFTPCVEAKGDTAFISDSPRKMMENGEFAKVPLIMGITDKEGLLGLMSKNTKFELINDDSSLLVPVDLKISPRSEEAKKLGKEIMQLYTHTGSLSWEAIQGYIDYITDILFAVGYAKSRQDFLDHNSSPVYTYLFSFTSPRALSALSLPALYPDKSKDFISGAGHADELVHLFKSNTSLIPFIPPTPSDQVFMDKILNAWTNFAKNGDPNCKELGVNWKPDSIQQPVHLVFGKVTKTVDDIIFPKRSNFWRKIYDKYSYAF